ncbi:MAG: TraB/GumN family protein [Sneathiella sp.]
MARIVAIVFALLLLSASYATSTVAETSPPENCPTRPYDKGRLWQVSKKGIPASFVFGTMHSKDPRILFLPGVIMQAFTNSTFFILETSLKDETVSKSQAAMFGGQGYSLRREIGDARFNQLADLASPYGIQDKVLDRFKIWAAASIISQPPQPKNPNKASLTLLDRELEKSARQMRKPVIPLETMEEQLAVFDQMSKIIQIEFLDQTMMEHSNLEDELERMTSHYLAGKTGWIFCDLELTLKEVSSGLSSLMTNTLIRDRNQKMVNRMLPTLQKGRSFVAVGALHLPGKEGILNLLRAQGFQIQRKF